MWTNWSSKWFQNGISQQKLDILLGPKTGNIWYYFVNVCAHTLHRIDQKFVIVPCRRVCPSLVHSGSASFSFFFLFIFLYLSHSFHWIAWFAVCHNECIPASNFIYCYFSFGSILSCVSLWQQNYHCTGDEQQQKKKTTTKKQRSNSSNCRRRFYHHLKAAQCGDIQWTAWCMGQRKCEIIYKKVGKYF